MAAAVKKKQGDRGAHDRTLRAMTTAVNICWDRLHPNFLAAAWQTVVGRKKKVPFFPFRFAAPSIGKAYIEPPGKRTPGRGGQVQDDISGHPQKVGLELKGD